MVEVKQNLTHRVKKSSCAFFIVPVYRFLLPRKTEMDFTILLYTGSLFCGEDDMKVEIFNTAEITGNNLEQKIAFDLFTKEQSGVYGVLCPEKDTIEPDKILEYPLPERCKEILQSLSIGEPLFYKYEVWHADRYEIKDPILLGRVQDPKNPTYTWNDKFFLIARWGEELESFNKLKERAIERLKNDSLVEAIKLKANLNAFMENAELFCKKAIEHGNTTFNVGQINL